MNEKSPQSFVDFEWTGEGTVCVHVPEAAGGLLVLVSSVVLIPAADGCTSLEAEDGSLLCVAVVPAMDDTAPESARRLRNVRLPAAVAPSSPHVSLRVVRRVAWDAARAEVMRAPLGFGCHAVELRPGLVDPAFEPVHRAQLEAAFAAGLAAMAARAQLERALVARGGAWAALLTPLGASSVREVQYTRSVVRSRRRLRADALVAAQLGGGGGAVAATTTMMDTECQLLVREARRAAVRVGAALLDFLGDARASWFDATGSMTTVAAGRLDVALLQQQEAVDRSALEATVLAWTQLATRLHVAHAALGRLERAVTAAGFPRALAARMELLFAAATLERIQMVALFVGGLFTPYVWPRMRQSFAGLLHNSLRFAVVRDESG